METKPENDQASSAPGNAVKHLEFPMQRLSETQVSNPTPDEAATKLPTEGC